MSLSAEDVNAELKRLDEPLRNAIINRITIVDALTEWGYAEEADALVDTAGLVVNRWLVASQEQTPDVNWMVCVVHGSRRWNDSTICEALCGALQSATPCSFAALDGFYVQPEGDER